MNPQNFAPTDRRDTFSTYKLQAFREICRESGLKLTHQRLEIFRILTNAEDHPSAEDVYERVKPKIPPISFDTVYRTLALFERCGVIARVNHLADRTRYDSNMTVHHHMVCTRCKKIRDFYWPALDEMETPGTTKGWGSIEGKYLELRGICRDCLEDARKKR
jgi:Fur family peroxide stress response transcriptional regulator